MRTCENCGDVHSGEYGSGRFCSTKCSRGFSTKSKREEINEKVSETLSKDKTNRSERNFVREASKHAAYSRIQEATSILDMSSRTTMKILKRMKLPCFSCGWYYEGVNGDIHHIDQRKNGGSDHNANLTYICPNCHRLAHSGVIKSEDLISIQDYLGDEWKKYYFTK